MRLTSDARKAREETTIEAMMTIYCRGTHGTRASLCDECEHLLCYAKQRIAVCPLRERKTTCAQCAVHCYAPAMRERIRQVMRYAGPRMMFAHPILTALHLLDSLK